MNPILFTLLFILAWILIYAFVRYLLVEEWLDPNYGSSSRFGSPLWLVAAVIITSLAIWGSTSIVRGLYFAPPDRVMRKGTVKEHQYDPPYTSHSFIMAGKTVVPTTHYHPARWWILVDGVDNSGKALRDWIDAGQNTYESYSNADSIYFKPVP